MNNDWSQHGTDAGGHLIVTPDVIKDLLSSPPSNGRHLFYFFRARTNKVLQREGEHEFAIVAIMLCIEYSNHEGSRDHRTSKPSYSA